MFCSENSIVQKSKLPQAIGTVANLATVVIGVVQFFWTNNKQLPNSLAGKIYLTVSLFRLNLQQTVSSENRKKKKKKKMEKLKQRCNFFFFLFFCTFTFLFKFLFTLTLFFLNFSFFFFLFIYFLFLFLLLLLLFLLHHFLLHLFLYLSMLRKNFSTTPQVQILLDVKINKKNSVLTIQFRKKEEKREKILKKNILF